MLVFDQYQTALLMNPKTGCMSLDDMFGHLASANDVYFHARLRNIDFTDYPEHEFFCFYRDPLERFVSAFRYALWVYRMEPETWEMAKPCFGVETPDEITADAVIDNLQGRAPAPALDLFTSQTDWLDHERVTPLPFSQFSACCWDLFDRFKLERPSTIPHLNATDAAVFASTMSDATKARVIDHYKKDYLFFERKGLM